MKQKRMPERRWLLCLVLLGFVAPSIYAQQQPAPQNTPPQQAPAAQPQATPPGPQRAAGPIVRQIEIQYAGPATLSRQRILTNMKTTVGQPYSETVVEDDVRALYATGLVTNVRIYGEPLPDGVKVIVVVQTRVTLASVYVVGNEKVKTSRIRKEMALGLSINPQWCFFRRFDVHHKPVRIQSPRHARTATEEGRRLGRERGHTDHHAIW